MAEDGCLGQGGADDGFRQNPGILLGGRADDFRLEQGRSALSVPCHFLRQIGGDEAQGLAEGSVIRALGRNLRIASKAVGQNQQGVVGAGVAVHGYHVEGIHYIGPQGFLQHLL